LENKAEAFGIAEHTIATFIKIGANSTIDDALNIFQRINLAISLNFLRIFAPFNEAICNLDEFELSSFAIEVSLIQESPMLTKFGHLSK
jgi:hypothetical protein